MVNKSASVEKAINIGEIEKTVEGAGKAGKSAAKEYASYFTSGVREEDIDSVFMGPATYGLDSNYTNASVIDSDDISIDATVIHTIDEEK